MKTIDKRYIQKRGEKYFGIVPWSPMVYECTKISHYGETMYLITGEVCG